MDVTAQPFAAAETDPNAQLQNAAEAFKAFDNPVADRKRDETGRFAPEQPEDSDDAELEAADETADEGEVEDVEEDAQEEADEAHPMPPSWGAEDAELWNTLPPETQAKIAAREGERDRGLNLKLQESANARKEAILAAQEAQTKRNDYLAALETVEALYTPHKPDPRAFGYGTAQYDAAGYNVALAQFEQQSAALAQLKEQRDAITSQAAEEEAKAFQEWKAQHEAQFAPRLLSDVPDLKDPAKGAPLINELVRYAIEAGIPEDVFGEGVADQITSAQIHLIWKAQQFDKIRGSKAAPKPKAGPVVKPGVSSTRSSTKAMQARKASERLAREGSIDAGAAIWKQALSG